MITLYIGDNASDKTRKLKDLVRENSLSVVTNIPTLKKDYLVDNTKLQYFKDYIYNDMCRYLVFDTPAKSEHEVSCRRLVELLFSKGDILVLDQLDSALTRQEIIDISDCISCISPLWKDIFVSGYDSDLLRMFTYIDIETGIEIYKPNVYLLENDKMTKLEDDDINEYFNNLE